MYRGKCAEIIAKEFVLLWHAARAPSRDLPGSDGSCPKMEMGRETDKGELVGHLVGKLVTNPEQNG